MIVATVRLESATRGFQPTSFGEWIGHEVEVTGIDRAKRAVLTRVENTEDGQYSTLTLNLYDHDVPNLTANLSVRPDTPKAQVRAHHHETGEHLTTALLDAPVHDGADVDINGARHRVTAVKWPYRDPEDPEDTEDYQHVTVTPTDAIPATVHDLGPAAGILGMLQ